jgi:hypothetical protein
MKKMKYDYNITHSKLSYSIQVDYWDSGWKLLAIVNTLEEVFDTIRGKEI